MPRTDLPKFVMHFDFLTTRQQQFYDLISNENNQIVLAHGLAGSGKSFIALRKGVEYIVTRRNPYKKLLIIKPTIDVGSEDKLGFLPGHLDEKIDQYFESITYLLGKIIEKDQIKKLIDDGKIEYKVVNFLRGTNLENSYVIIDEAQNMSPLQLKTICTRISDDTKLVIQGDMTQCDKYNGDYKKCGFYDIWYRFNEVKGVQKIEFDENDCVRSGIVKRVLDSYKRDSFIYLNGVKKND